MATRSTASTSESVSKRLAAATRPRDDDDDAPLDHAVRLIYHVCCLAGSTTLVSESRKQGTGLGASIRRRDTPTLFDAFVSALSYQGISNYVAEQYMARHGRATWHDLETAMQGLPSCPKLRSYWHFKGCRYDKGSHTCAEPDHIGHCPLPDHDLRNGRLNQTAYSLYLFVRDIADNDLVGWIDKQLAEAETGPLEGRLARMREALVGPLRHVFGAADKVLTMTLSGILMSAPKSRPLWSEVGFSMIAVDTLVHNFLHRTGILQRFDALHAYGTACYQAGGCADIIEASARHIDARKFNPAFPETFARFVQHAIWSFCAQQELDICNGNRIDDRHSCQNSQCRLHMICDRMPI